MVIVMDKMKDHSCAIQPAFGYGAGGGVGLFNFTNMFEQVFNADNLVSPVDDEPLDPLLNFPPIEEMFPIIANPQLLTAGPIVNGFTQSFLAVEQAYQSAGTGNQQPQLSIAELITNAVNHHHPTTHHAPQTETVVNESNNTHQPYLNVSNAIQNAFLEHLNSPPPPPSGSSGMSSHSFPFQTLNNAPGTTSIPVGVFDHYAVLSNQSQSYISVAPTTAVQSVAAVQPGVAELLSTWGTLGQLNQQLTSQPPNLSDMLLSNTHSPVPPDEESNSSIPPFNAPVSSPVHPFFPNNFNASDDEVYVPPVISNIIVVDSAGNSDNVSENQINNPDVPN